MTVPDTVAVGFKLREVKTGTRLEQISQNEATLYFRPAGASVGKMVEVTVTGSTSDTTINYTVLFDVQAKKSGKLKYVLIGAGGVAVTAMAIALAGGGDEGGDDPPKPEPLDGFPAMPDR